MLINKLFPVSGDEQEVQLRRRQLQEGAGPAGSHARPGQVRRVRGEGGGAGRGGRGDAAPRARHPAVPRLSRQLLQVIQTRSDCSSSSHPLLQTGLGWWRPGPVPVVLPAQPGQGGDLRAVSSSVLQTVSSDQPRPSLSKGTYELLIHYPQFHT